MSKRILLFTATIIFAFFAQFFLTSSGIISPLESRSAHEVSIMDEVVRPLLSQNKNQYFLHKKPAAGLIPAAEASSYTNDAKSYAVIDFESGDVILEKALETRLPMASLTKIMTAVVALDLVSPEEYFIMDEVSARQIPTKIGVVPGEKMNVEELLHAVLLTSANDAAEAVRRGVDKKYGEEIFIEAMNEKAKLIGLKNTSFENPQGFDGRNHYSTAEDLAILSHYALMHYPLISEIVAKDYEFLPEDNNHKQFDLYNWNGLIGVYPNTIGLKIGNTGRAGKTTIVLSEREGKKILVVVLNAPTIFERDIWAADLLDEGFMQTLGLSKIGVTRSQLQAKYNTWN